MKILLSKATIAAPESANYIRIRDLFAERMRRIQAGVGSKAAMFSQLAAVQTHKVSDTRLRRLKESKVPVMVMRGDEDNLVRIANSDKIAKALGVEVVVLADCGHGLVDERPARVVAEMVQFYKYTVQVQLVPQTTTAPAAAAPATVTTPAAADQASSAGSAPALVTDDR